MLLATGSRQRGACRTGLFRLLVDQLTNISHLVGFPAAQTALQAIKQGLPLVASPSTIRQLAGCYWVNEALAQGKTGAYGQACRSVFQAFRNDPAHLCNRGAWATLVRSALSYWPRPQSTRELVS